VLRVLVWVCRSRATVSTTVQASGAKKVDIKKQGLESVKNPTIQNNLKGISKKMEAKDWVDPQGRKGKVSPGSAWMGRASSACLVPPACQAVDTGLQGGWQLRFQLGHDSCVVESASSCSTLGTFVVSQEQLSQGSGAEKFCIVDRATAFTSSPTSMVQTWTATRLSTPRTPGRSPVTSTSWAPRALSLGKGLFGP
jgi:hypothetical protein